MVASEARVEKTEKREKSALVREFVKFPSGRHRNRMRRRIWFREISARRAFGIGIDAFPDVGDDRKGGRWVEGKEGVGEVQIGTIIRMTGAAGGVEWKREGESNY